MGIFHRDQKQGAQVAKQKQQKHEGQPPEGGDEDDGSEQAPPSPAREPPDREGQPPAPDGPQGPPIGTTIDPNAPQDAATAALDLTPEATLEQKRAFLVAQGLGTAEELERVDPNSIEDLVKGVAERRTNALAAQRQTLEREQEERNQRLRDGGAPTLEQRIEQELQHRSREDLIALVTTGRTLTVPEAAQLSSADLRAAARGVLGEKFETDQKNARFRKGEPVLDRAPAVATPYGDDPPQHYVVLERHSYVSDGQVKTLDKADIINGVTHDIAALVRAGVKLIRCDPPGAFVPTL